MWWFIFETSSFFALKVIQNFVYFFLSFCLHYSLSKVHWYFTNLNMTATFILNKVLWANYYEHQLIDNVTNFVCLLNISTKGSTVCRRSKKQCLALLVHFVKHKVYVYFWFICLIYHFAKFFISSSDKDLANWNDFK